MMTLSKIREGYISKQANPRDLISSLVREIRKIRIVQNDAAWIHVATDEQIDAQLSNLEKSAIADKPLFGVPFAIKDNIDIAGWETTAACPEYAYAAEHTARCVLKLQEAGAILLGKTNLDQFATGLVGTRSPYGIVTNVFDPEYISGGSSTGSASVVARGLVAFSLGTDTAGSGRVPAGFNNIVGLKPTPGLVSNTGVVPACRTLDCVSIFALTAADAASVLEVIRSTPDEIETEESYHSIQRLVPRLPDTPRIGVPANPEFFGNSEYRNSFAAAIEFAASMGGQVNEFELGPFSDVAELLYSGPWVAERYAVIAELLAARPEAVNETVREVILNAENFSAVDAFNALYKLKRLEIQCKQVWNDFDVLMVPTAPTHPLINDVMMDPIRLNSRLGIYTNFVNLLGYAALALPAGFTSGGMPFGVTFIAPGGYDLALLRFAAQWQHENDISLGLHLGNAAQGANVLPDSYPGYTIISVVGAHLQGMPLHYQLEERKCIFIKKSLTSSKYRLYALAGTVPPKPGLARSEQNGASIEIEIYAMPSEAVGSFLQLIPPPLGLGNVELSDGSWIKGFICEPYGLHNAMEISEYGGWRAYIENHKKT